MKPLFQKVPLPLRITSYSEMSNMGKKLPDLFAGLLFCGDCYSQLVQRKLRYKDKETFYYICSTYNNGRGCSRHTIKQDALVDLVLTFIHHHLDWKSYLIKIMI